MENTRRFRFGAHRHSTSGAEREKRDWLACLEFIGMIVVSSDAIAPVPVAIQPHAVERDAEPLNDADSGLMNGDRKGADGESNR